MKEFEYVVDENRFVCQIDPTIDGVRITGCRGTGTRLSLPEQVFRGEEMYVVREIGKKAFLGNRGLRSVEIPVSVRTIGDWAFAQCEQLEGVSGLARDVIFGNGVFMGSNHLEHIIIEETHIDDLSILLGTTIYKMPSEDLLRDSERGTTHWYQKWDQRLLSFLQEEDVEGYTDLVLCGEEDIQRSEPEYVSDKRRRKAGLCLCRLKWNCLLESEVEKIYRQYLLEHTKGSESEEAWEYMIQEHGDDLEYYRLFAKVGCVREDNIDAMIQDLGGEHAEAKSYLMQYKQEQFGTKDVFDQFLL
ncbi:MAG: leucine-rich repeat protein [Eubacteriales bacterium]|nr:leucine-rich repeat protein [Eubacteriales bacterium]